MRYQWLVVLTFLLPSQAEAYFYDGNWLYEQCSSDGNSINAFNCASFLGGVGDALGDSNFAKQEFTICLPENTKIRQMRDVVMNALKAFPEKRTDAAVDLVQKALSKAWPCPWQQ